MKILASICLLMICLTAGAEDAKGEIGDGQVLKVYSCKDGDYKFLAYEVKWKDQEVIVGDTLVRSDYHVGDTIRFSVSKTRLPNANPEFLLHFELMPPMPKLPPMPQIPQGVPNARPAQPTPTT